MPQTEISINKRPGIAGRLTSWVSSLMHRSRSLFMGIWNREVIIDINADKAVSEGFNGNTAVYSIVMKDANKFASIPRYLLDAKQFNKSRVIKAFGDGIKVNNRLSKLLERPNPGQGQAAFFKQARAFFKVCGEVFIELNRGDIEGKTDDQIEKMEVIEMYVLPSNKVRIIPDAENVWGVAGYKIMMGGSDRIIHRKNVIHWKDVNLNWDAVTREHLRGMTALKPGEETLTANQDGEKATVRMQQNDGAKGVVYGKERIPLEPAQKSQLDGVVDRKINSYDKKGSVASIFGIGDLGYLNLGGTSVDMQLLESKDQSWRYLCNLLDVPYLLFDPKATFANLSESKKNWVNDSIIPACKEFDDELNRVLLRAFLLEGKAIISSDYTELPELQEDMKMLSEWLNNSDEITPNEKRVAKGYEERPEPEFDEPWIKPGTQPLSRVLEDDGFDDLMNEIGAVKPNGKLNGQAQGKLNGQKVEPVKN